MVKKMIVVLSAMALIITAVGVASAWMPAMAGGGCAVSGDMIMIPMKVKTAYSRATSGTIGGDSTLLLCDCEQYTAPGGFRPWGVWKGTRCTMKVQVIPPKCVAPPYGGPVAWGAPPPVMPGGHLVSNIEKYSIASPGCNPCVTSGLKYEVIKKQQVQ